MYGYLYDFLEFAMLDDARVEVRTKCDESFSGISAGYDDGDDDLGWRFRDVSGWSYDMIHLKDIAAVRRLDTGEMYAPPQVAAAQEENYTTPQLVA